MNSEKLRAKWKDPQYREMMIKAHLGQNKGKKWPKWFGERISKGLTGKKLSIEHRKILSASHMGKKQPWKAGEKHWNWKGGKSGQTRTIRNSIEYRRWRKDVLVRDNHSCVECGCEKREKLQADHIKPFSLFPELRFEITNGRTLCFDCHRRTPTWGGRIKMYEINLG